MADAEFLCATDPKTVLALLDEIDRLKAENDALRKFSAEAYQVLGALDAPENVLDNASDAANGVPLRHESYCRSSLKTMRHCARMLRGIGGCVELHTSIHRSTKHSARLMGMRWIMRSTQS